MTADKKTFIATFSMSLEDVAREIETDVYNSDAMSSFDDEALYTILDAAGRAAGPDGTGYLYFNVLVDVDPNKCPAMSIKEPPYKELLQRLYGHLLIVVRDGETRVPAELFREIETVLAEVG